MTDSAKLKRSTWRRWSWRVLALLLLVLVALVGRAFWQLRATPSYWDENQAFLKQTPSPELDQLAKAVETRLPREFTRPIGPGEGERTIRVNFDEANAWLAVRLRPYLQNQGVELPPEIGSMMLTQRDGQLVVAFDYLSSQLGQRVASLYFNTAPATAPGSTDPGDGKEVPATPASFGVEKLLAGNQPLGVRYALEYLRKMPTGDEAARDALVDRLQASEMVPFPVIPVDEHREATVLGVNVEPEGIDLRLLVRFKPKPGADAQP